MPLRRRLHRRTVARGERPNWAAVRRIRRCDFRRDRRDWEYGNERSILQLSADFADARLLRVDPVRLLPRNAGGPVERGRGQLPVLVDAVRLLLRCTHRQRRFARQQLLRPCASAARARLHDLQQDKQEQTKRFDNHVHCRPWRKRE